MDLEAFNQVVRERNQLAFDLMMARQSVTMAYDLMCSGEGESDFGPNDVFARLERVVAGNAGRAQLAGLHRLLAAVREIADEDRPRNWCVDCQVWVTAVLRDEIRGWRWDCPNCQRPTGTGQIVRHYEELAAAALDGMFDLPDTEVSP